jgi:hypothetical protein
MQIKETFSLHTTVAWGLPRIVPAAGLNIFGRSFNPGVS